MNNKGWGLQEMLVLSGILVIGLIIVAVLINQTFGDNEGITKPNNPPVTETENTNKSYKDMEKSVNEAANKYISDTYKDEIELDKVIVTVKTLESTDYLKPLYDYKNNKRKCSGYVIVEKNESLTFSSYVSCGLKYKTKDYDASFDA